VDLAEEVAWACAPPFGWFIKFKISSFIILPLFPLPWTCLKSILCSLAKALTAGVARVSEDLDELWVVSMVWVGLEVSAVFLGSGSTEVVVVFTVNVSAVSSTSISKRTWPTSQASSSPKHLLWIFPFSELGICVKSLSVATSTNVWYYIITFTRE